MKPTEQKSILIVDDEEAVRFFVGNALLQVGWQVQEADSGEQALALLKERTPDVLLLDLRMNGLDGLDVLAAMNGALSETVVIIMTAYASVDSAVTAIQYRVFDYLRKPCDTQLVINAVERAWQEKQARRQSQNSGTTAVVTPHIIQTADLQIDLNAHTVSQNQQAVSLTPTEYEILACLAEQIGQPVAIHHLISTALDFDPTDPQAQETLRVHISRLRSKIGSQYIRTLRGGKYLLAHIQPT